MVISRPFNDLCQLSDPDGRNMVVTYITGHKELLQNLQLKINLASLSKVVFFFKVPFFLHSCK
jgi:hypothetical protein